MSFSKWCPLLVYFLGASPVALFYKPLEEFIDNPWLLFFLAVAYFYGIRRIALRFR